ncbi:hypothetical protein TNCV_1884821 [Trichonephila clavipes]|nr:hypothetical protein TNCV_1884821 [Trichonephila clavipes]
MSRGPEGSRRARISWTSPDFLVINFDPSVPRGLGDLLPEPEKSLNRHWSGHKYVRCEPHKSCQIWEWDLELVARCGMGSENGKSLVLVILIRTMKQNY